MWIVQRLFQTPRPDPGWGGVRKRTRSCIVFRSEDTGDCELLQLQAYFEMNRNLQLFSFKVFKDGKVPSCQGEACLAVVCIFLDWQCIRLRVPDAGTSRHGSVKVQKVPFRGYRASCAAAYKGPCTTQASANPAAGMQPVRTRRDLNRAVRTKFLSLMTLLRRHPMASSSYKAYIWAPINEHTCASLQGLRTSNGRIKVKANHPVLPVQACCASCRHRHLQATGAASRACIPAASSAPPAPISPAGACACTPWPAVGAVVAAVGAERCETSCRVAAAAHENPLTSPNRTPRCGRRRHPAAAGAVGMPRPPPCTGSRACSAPYWDVPSIALKEKDDAGRGGPHRQRRS